MQVVLDVQQFSPNEITVRVIENAVVVEGKHDEKMDEHGYISRHFVRKYVLPKDAVLSDVTSALSSDGVLTITAPKKVGPPEFVLQEKELLVMLDVRANAETQFCRDVPDKKA